jgi:S-DNA-T family DNA segregation ATPase FtsK/SpoIIIE
MAQRERNNPPVHVPPALPGVLLLGTGLVAVLALILPAKGGPLSSIATAQSWLLGWAAPLIPLALLCAGLWAISPPLRSKVPVRWARGVGILILVLDGLAWLHLLAGGGWDLASRGGGGGHVAAAINGLLISGLGRPGAIVLLVAGLLAALALCFDLSPADLIERASNGITRLRQKRTAAVVPPFLPFEDIAGPSFSRFAGSGDTLSAEETAVMNPEHPSGGKPSSSGTRSQSGLSSAARSSQSPPKRTDWPLPSTDLILDPAVPTAGQDYLDRDQGHMIEATLRAFGAPAHVVAVQHGPNVTLYGVEPDLVESRGGAQRVRVSKILSLADDLALALAAPRIRIQAPVPGQSYIGIEVPNPQFVPVPLREVVETDAFRKKRTPLRFALGKDMAGQPVVTDLENMPHLLIAGTTGSGKSVCINALLCCLLLQNTPGRLRLLLIDPKRVELAAYNGIPHLLAPVIVDAEQVVLSLQWALREMDRRYHLFAEQGVRNLREYNTRTAVPLPAIVIVIDELADLMMVAPEQTERSITRLAQMARATGMHLVIATQRPSVDVVTGLIKANFPTRIAFMVASNVDSRVILDQPGAERLLGHGDMLYQGAEAPGPIRVQGSFVSEDEIQRLVTFWRQAALGQSSPVGEYFYPAIAEGQDVTPLSAPSQFGAPAPDPLLAQATEVVRREGRASVSLLQRRLSIGYTRAARLLDLLETKGVIGPAQPNTQVRPILEAPPPDAGPAESDPSDPT